MTETMSSREVRAAALVVLARADAALEGWSCPASTECCQFGLTGREPYLTEAEWLVLEAEVKRQGRRLPAARPDRVCPFLTGEGRCSVYPARPLGCRTFFCHRASGPRTPRAALTSLARELEDLGDPDARGRPLTSWLSRPR